MKKFDETKLPSNKSFGFFFSTIFLLAAFYFYDGIASFIDYTLLLISLIILLTAIFKSELLRPFNKLWMKFGFFIGKVISPLILGSIYFFVITPLALFLKLKGRDELRLNKLKLKSYWKYRKYTARAEADSFKNQF